MAEKTIAGRFWLWGLSASIVLLMAFFIGFAIWSYQRDVDLVYDNYYQKDIVYEQQIRREERTEALPVKPSLQYSADFETLTLMFPAAMSHRRVQGEVLLFRPSDLHQDQMVPINLKADTLQIIDVSHLMPGFWRAKLSWTHAGLEYYLERSFNVQ